MFATGVSQKWGGGAAVWAGAPGGWASARGVLTSASGGIAVGRGAGAADGGECFAVSDGVAVDGALELRAGTVGTGPAWEEAAGWEAAAAWLRWRRGHKASVTLISSRAAASFFQGTRREGCSAATGSGWLCGESWEEDGAEPRFRKESGVERASPSRLSSEPSASGRAS